MKQYSPLQLSPILCNMKETVKTIEKIPAKEPVKMWNYLFQPRVSWGQLGVAGSISPWIGTLSPGYVEAMSKSKKNTSLVGIFFLFLGRVSYFVELVD